MEFDPDDRPDAVRIPIADLLGEKGHEYCAGYRIVEVGGRLDAALDCRAAWVDAKREGRDPDVPEPRCVPIESFEGGSIRFAFRVNGDKTGYEIGTMYVEPPELKGGEK